MKESSFAFLKIVVKALASQVPVLSYWAEDMGDMAQGVAKDVHAKWTSQRGPAERVIDLEGFTAVTPQEIRDAIAQEPAANPDPAWREAAANYTLAMAGRVRSTMASPEDPTGRTIPAGLVPQSAADILRFLPERAPRFKAGDCPVGRWQLVQLIGSGGFSEVWQAQHRDFPNRTAALKFCLDSGAAHELDALVRETGLLSRLEKAASLHPGIVPILETYLENNPPCLAYEYVEGGTLTGVITEWHRVRGGPTPEEAAGVIRRLAEIIAVCHAQQPPIVHRDLKPANILVQYSPGGELRLRITDFGIGGLGGAMPVSLTQQNVSRVAVASAHGSHSPLYASPQQMAGADPDPRDDIYALGVIWHQLLDGDLTIGAPSGEWMSDLQHKGMEEPLLRLLAKCLATKPGARIASAAELIARFETSVVSKPPQPPVGTGGHGTGQRAGEERSFEIYPGVKVAFCWCPPGEFIMGDAKVQRQIPRGFWMAKYPCTQSEWKAVIGRRPSKFKGGGRPVEQVSWNDAQQFLKKLKSPSGWFYGLPTESQWEYACRAGTTTEFAFGDVLNGQRIIANCSDAMIGQTTDVSTYPANQWGLHDMHGNVWEWCADYYADNLTPGPDTGGAPTGTHRVLRGGSWLHASSLCRSANRISLQPAFRFNSCLGFRVAAVSAGR